MIISSSRSQRRAGFASVLIAFVVFLTGCGGSQKAATLSGKVTYPTPDHPVTGGAITVHPSDGRPISAPIKWDGSFILGEVPIGDLKVTIETESIKELFAVASHSRQGEMKPPASGRPIPFDAPNMPRYIKIPRKYAQRKTTPLIYTVETTGAQTKDFNLTD